MAEHGVACHQNFCSCLHYSRDGIQGDVPLVACGHLHRFLESTDDGTTVLHTGTVGAGGLGAFRAGQLRTFGAVLLYLAAPELSEGAHDELHLRQVPATPRAGPPVRFAALMIAPGQGGVQVGGDELHELAARHVGR